MGKADLERILHCGYVAEFLVGIVQPTFRLDFPVPVAPSRTPLARFAPLTNSFLRLAGTAFPLNSIVALTLYVPAAPRNTAWAGNA
jgi:hypothetical protein